MRIKTVCLAAIFLFGLKHLKAQTNIGDSNSSTKLILYEYYNHTGPEWVKLFRVKNYNADLGFWGKGGVAGRVYFVDYQGKGGSYVDFSFPQFISAQQKPVITMSGASAKDLEWYAFPGDYGAGQSYYDVYIKTPPNHLGLSFLLRANDFESFFTNAAQPALNPIWSYSLYPESFTYFSENGNLGLGTITPAERLSVNGNIRAKEIKVETANWPDYVFAKDYSLPSLAETEKHIKEKGHLLGIPSAEEVKANGIDLGDMNARLLKKIEELTLHLIEKEKKDMNQQLEINLLKQQVKEILSSIHNK